MLQASLSNLVCSNSLIHILYCNIAIVPLSWQNRTSIQKNSRHISPCYPHQSPWKTLITTGNTDYCVILMCYHHYLDRICNDLPTYERCLHPSWPIAMPSETAM